MGENPGTAVIEKMVLIQASPAVIYRALTEAREIANWFCDRATSDPRVGGELKAYWRLGSGGEAQRGRAVFTRLIPETLVELHWEDEGAGKAQDGQQHIISYSIRLKRGTSEVRVRDEGPDLTDADTQEILDQGWIGILRDLKEHCETKQRSVRRRSTRDALAQ